MSPWERAATATASALARLAGAATRALGREGGSITGRVFLALAPAAGARRVARGAGRRTVLVTGTNGKTTTAALIACSFDGEVASNRTGANLLGGIYTAILRQPAAAVAVLEIDEAALPAGIAAVQPTVIALLNLSRDQLDRTQEVRRLAERWRAPLATFTGTVVANADDPLVVWAVRQSTDVRWVAAGQPWLVDATACPSCGGTIVVDDGRWRCSRCSLRRPATGPVAGIPSTGLPGRCNRANAAMAAATVEELGGRIDAATWAGVESVAGRYERGAVEGREVRLLLAKNPAGWLETLGMLEPGRPIVLALNDRLEDGRDPSWIWDVPFERLSGSHVVCTGARATDLAVRLDYAGVDATIEPDVRRAVLRQPRGPVDVAANYSAFRLARRRLLRA